MSADYSRLSGLDLVEAFRNRRLTPVDALEAALARLAEVDKALNIACHLDVATGRAMAEASAARWRAGTPMGPLDGVPVAVKDASHVRGWPTRFGSHTMDPSPQAADTPGVARLREAGAVFFVKTTTPEYGWKGLTDSPLTGITRNPWDAAKTPGGSSGGSAVAVATGVAPIATGGDGGGSVRIPASYTGTFGLKATFGRIPAVAGPMVPLATFGCQTRTVADSALALSVVSGPDPRDTFPVPGAHQDFLPALDLGVKGLRIAVSRDLGFPIVDDEVAGAVEATIGVLARAGAHITEIDLDLSYTRPFIGTFWRFGYASFLGALSAADLQQLEPDLLDLLVSTRDTSAHGLQATLDGMRLLTARMQALHQDFDLLVTPTMPLPPFEVGRNVPDDRFAEWFDWSPLTWPFNLSRQPAASVPCGFTKAGLPIGFQIAGPLWSEARILGAARVIERDLPQPMATETRYP